MHHPTPSARHRADQILSDALSLSRSEREHLLEVLNASLAVDAEAEEAEDEERSLSASCG